MIEPSPTRLSRTRGCLIGGAVGDALGAPVEFLSLGEIRNKYGAGGITAYDIAYGRKGAITDDTQMTLFTAEGLLRAQNRMRERGIANPPFMVHDAYLRWLMTQGETSQHDNFRMQDMRGLVNDERLHARRGPGNTCLSALMGDRIGTTGIRLNESKGCGGIMRVAPVGLIALPDRAFELGRDIAALTHSHPSGYLAAGTLALIIALVLEDWTLDGALTEATRELRSHEGHEECASAITEARRAAEGASASAEVVEQLGEGWVAEEALGISLYCALACKGDFETGVRLAVNHSGDSDSTGAITCNLLGAMLGEEAIPERWLDKLELSDVVLLIADDVHAAATGREISWERYPGR